MIKDTEPTEATPAGPTEPTDNQGNPVPDYSLDDYSYADPSPLPSSSEAIWDVENTASTFPLTRFWVREGESALFRFVTRATVKASVHFTSSGDGKRGAVRCNAENGKQCVLCLGGTRPLEVHLLPIYNVGDGDLGVLTLYKDSGPGSLLGQLAPLIKRSDYTNLILELGKVGTRNHVRLLKTVDPTKPDDRVYGDAVLQDIVSRGLPKDADVLATVEGKSNGQLLLDTPGLERKILLRHPGLNIGQLHR